MDTVSFIHGKAYLIKGQFADLGFFLKKVSNYIKESRIEKSNILYTVQSTIEYLKNKSGPVTQESALKRLIADDLKKIVNMENSEKVIDTQEMLAAQYEDYKDILAKFGFNIKYPKIYFVDNFPKPYHTMQWSACSPDKEDEIKYGIKPGFYFRKDKLVPFKSSFILAHEIIHAIIAASDPFFIGRGLEDGICDLVGSVLLGGRVIGFDICKNYLTYEYLSYHNNQFSEIYLDYFRLATSLYLQFGFDGIFYLIKRGRQAIKKVESSCLSGTFNEINLPMGQWDLNVNRLVNFITLMYPRNMVVSPLAKFIAGFLKKGDSVRKIIAINNIDASQGEEAIRELQERVYLVLINGDVIDYSEIEYLETNNFLRYELI
ncbi:hypothetical protein ES707_05800 [subsurface metagenome]